MHALRTSVYPDRMSSSRSTSLICSPLVVKCDAPHSEEFQRCSNLNRRKYLFPNKTTWQLGELSCWQGWHFMPRDRGPRSTEFSPILANWLSTARDDVGSERSIDVGCPELAVESDRQQATQSRIRRWQKRPLVSFEAK